MAFGKDPHDGDHASAQGGGHKISWRKGGSFPTVIDRSIRQNSVTGRDMKGLSLQLPVIFYLDFDHERSIAALKNTVNADGGLPLVIVIASVVIVLVKFGGARLPHGLRLLTERLA